MPDMDTCNEWDMQTYCPVLIKEISTSKRTKTDYGHNGLTGKIRIRIGKMR